VGGGGGVGNGGRNQVGSGNRTNVGNGNRQVNGGNRNISGNGNTINIDNDGGWGGWGDYPVGAGLAIGAVAGFTAAAIGSAYYALPHGCAPYPYGGYSYYSCGGAYYEPRYEGDTVVYVTVPEPGSSASTTTSTTVSHQ
jgi:hypothetical protein